MSEPKLISPMLDNFIMGDPVSDRCGIRCCPAMEKNSDEKYIVKIISIPASQTQLDALLLSGAYPSAEAAQAYFKELSDSVVKEIEVLQLLSKQDGFLPYDSWQVVPMEDATGYDVYMLSPYKRSLERHFQRTPMTHLGALNLGLDMCAALAVARRSGYLYTDLKPSNIFVTGKQSYRIGDIGFIRLDSLKYASLPDQYRSSYTAPEITDAFSCLNTTIDIYAAGLILYQAYNNGQLPFRDGTEPGEPLPAPEYADYELAQIILKACDPDPEKRWEDPIQMGQALVSYMQQYGANDTPIVPIPVVEEPQEEAPATTEEVNEENTSEEIAEAEIQEDVPPVADENEAEPGKYEAIEPTEGALEETETATTEDTADATAEEVPEETSEPEADQFDLVFSEDDLGNLNFLDSLTNDETVQELNASDIEYTEVTEEVSEMMAQADELAAHEVPEPAVAPEKIDIPFPEPIITVTKTEASQEDAAEADAAQEDSTPSEESEDNAEESTELADQEEVMEETLPAEPKPKKHILRKCLLAVLLAALLIGGFCFYRFYYVQTIDSMTLTGDNSTLSISVSSQMDPSLLHVVCADAYGNKLIRPLTGGTAVFENLLTSTEYTVTVQTESFHHLIGDTSKTYFTPTQTKIVQMSMVTGSADGSAILGFTVDGPDAESWILHYSAPGEEEKSISFTGHMATVSGLSVGTTYTFTLSPETNLFLTGDNQLSFTASTLIYAENLAITDITDTSLSASWNAPEGVAVEGWTVRCYNEAGYNETLTTTDTFITFEGLDGSRDYNVEVIAQGQSVSQRTYVGENAIAVSDFTADASVPGPITLSWHCDAQIPQGGWLVTYTIKDLDQEFSIATDTNSAVLEEAIPGKTYTFTVTAADGTAVVCQPVICATAEAREYSCNYQNFPIQAKDFTLKMCKTPAKANWDRHDLSNSDYTSTFAVGEKASFAVRITKVYGTSNDSITTLYIFRDAEGNIVSFCANTEVWASMWNRYYGELDIPALPDTPGEYTVSVYFNGALVDEQPVTITP